MNEEFTLKYKEFKAAVLAEDIEYIQQIIETKNDETSKMSDFLFLVALKESKPAALHALTPIGFEFDTNMLDLAEKGGNSGIIDSLLKLWSTHKDGQPLLEHLLAKKQTKCLSRLSQLDAIVKETMVKTHYLQNEQCDETLFKLFFPDSTIENLPPKVIQLNKEKNINLLLSDMVLTRIYGFSFIYKADGYLSSGENIEKTVLSIFKMPLVQVHVQDQKVLVQVFDTNIKESLLAKELNINNNQAVLHDMFEKNHTTYLLFKPINGTTLEDWNRQKTFIEDILLMPIDIEEYDSLHDLYDSNYYSGKLIIIRENNISVLADALHLGGKYITSKIENFRSTYYFENVGDESLWHNRIDDISAFIGKRLGIKSYDAFKKVLILEESIEEALPRVLDIKDPHGTYSSFVAIQEEEGRCTYFYSQLNGISLHDWKDRLKRTSLRTLFNEPNKVYKLEEYDRSSPYYDPSFSQTPLIMIHEYVEIPGKEALMGVEVNDFLQKEKIFWGYGSGSSLYHTAISSTSHFMAIGGTGSGKSNFMNGVILSLLHNIDLVGKLYLIDLKSGVEFNKYKNLDSDKIEVFSRETKPSSLLRALQEVEAQMYLRNEYMASAGLAHIDEAPIFVIIDEFAQIELMPTFEHAERSAKEQILDTLLRIGSLARASNIKLFLQTQDPRAVPEELKKHLMSRSLMKTGSALDADKTIQQSELINEMGINHLRFDKGRYVFEDYNGGDTQLNELQFPFVDPSKNLHMNYRDAAQNNTDSLRHQLTPFIPSIISTYGYLAHTAVLGGKETAAVKPTETISVPDKQPEITPVTPVPSPTGSTSEDKIGLGITLDLDDDLFGDLEEKPEEDPFAELNALANEGKSLLAELDDMFKEDK